MPYLLQSSNNFFLYYLGAFMEGSNMGRVNLRVATLKNANLQNCDLRQTDFAGANLEVFTY